MEFFPKRSLIYGTSLKKADIFHVLKNQINVDNILLNTFKLNISDNSFTIYGWDTNIYNMGVVFNLFCLIKETPDGSLLSIQVRLKIEKKLFFYYVAILLVYLGYAIYTGSFDNLTADNFIIFTIVYYTLMYSPARLLFDNEFRDLKKELEKIFENKLILKD